LTVEKLKASHISGLADLPGRPVGPLTGTSIFPFLRGLRHPLNRALLQLMDSGIMVDMAKRYFGTVYQP
jgi:ABC-type amino acid transport substrate-binding protein